MSSSAPPSIFCGGRWPLPLALEPRLRRSCFRRPRGSGPRRARMDWVGGRVASASGAGTEAPAQLLSAAKRLEPLDVSLARETYLDAWGAALFAGPLAGAAGLLDASRAARSAPRAPQAP